MEKQLVHLQIIIIQKLAVEFEEYALKNLNFNDLEYEL